MTVRIYAVNRPLSDVGHNRYNTKADLILAFLLSFLILKQGTDETAMLITSVIPHLNRIWDFEMRVDKTTILTESPVTTGWEL